MMAVTTNNHGQLVVPDGTATNGYLIVDDGESWFQQWFMMVHDGSCWFMISMVNDGSKQGTMSYIMITDGYNGQSIVIMVDHMGIMFFFHHCESQGTITNKNG